MVTNPTTEMWEDMRRQGITPGQTGGGGGERITPVQTRDQLHYVVMIAINSGVLAGIRQRQSMTQNTVPISMRLQILTTNMQNSDILFTKRMGGSLGDQYSDTLNVVGFRYRT